MAKRRGFWRGNKSKSIVKYVSIHLVKFMGVQKRELKKKEKENEGDLPSYE